MKESLKVSKDSAYNTEKDIKMAAHSRQIDTDYERTNNKKNK